MDQYELKPEFNKGYMCLFTVEGHRTWRQLFARKIETIEIQLKTNIGKAVVTNKKFFEIDYIKGTIEEF